MQFIAKRQKPMLQEEEIIAHRVIKSSTGEYAKIEVEEVDQTAIYNSDIERNQKELLSGPVVLTVFGPKVVPKLKPFFSQARFRSW